MPANLPSLATWLQWIKELVQNDCEGSGGERTYVGDEIVEASLQVARRAPHQNYGKILCRDGAGGERLFWLQSKFRERSEPGVTLRESRTLSVRKGEQAAKEQAAAARVGVGVGNGGVAGGVQAWPMISGQDQAMRQMVREVVEPLIGELRTFMKVDHMEDMRKIIRHEIQEVVKMQLGASVGNIQLLADEVRNMQVLRSKDQLDIAQLRLQSQQALPIQMLPQYVNHTYTPNVSPMGGYGMDIPSGQGVGSDTMHKRSAEQVGETDLRDMIANAAKEFLVGGNQQQEGATGQQGMVGAGGSSGQLGGMGVARSASPMGPGLLRQGNCMQNWARQQLAASGQQTAQAETMRQLQEQQQRQQAGAMEQQTQALGLQQQVQQQHGLDLQQYQQQAAQQQQPQQMQQQQMLQQQQLMAQQQQLLQAGQQGQATLSTRGRLWGPRWGAMKRGGGGEPATTRTQCGSWGEGTKGECGAGTERGRGYCGETEGAWKQMLCCYGTCSVRRTLRRLKLKHWRCFELRTLGSKVH